MADATVEIKLTEWPEGLHMIVIAFTRMLNEGADAEADPRIARKLRELAARFESGQWNA